MLGLGRLSQDETPDESNPAYESIEEYKEYWKNAPSVVNDQVRSIPEDIRNAFNTAKVPLAFVTGGLTLAYLLRKRSSF